MLIAAKDLFCDMLQGSFIFSERVRFVRSQYRPSSEGTFP
jgi:hypothetical protein